MPHYQSSDTLSTTTDVSLSGSGTSTPEPTAGNDDYSAWPWESVLATVLSIPIPDRGDVTGQSWLTISHDGQPNPGAHLIWTAGWNTSQNSGATSIEIYLNPDLYTVGGPWDGFLNTPPQALSQVSSHQYNGLPLGPPSFDAAGLSLSSVTDFWDSAAQQLGAMHTDATSGSIVGFQGNLASVAADLLNHLQTVAVSLHEQLTVPVRYSDSIDTAGGSADTFLADLLSAYASWTQVVPHSPLGAIVTVLEQIATPDGNGGYVIADPQNTPFGDLTVDSTWQAVEQQAKNLWTSTLTGMSDGYAGLDLLGRTALNKLVTQFTITTSDLVPVVGPATPPANQNPVDPTPNKNGPNDLHVNIPPPGGNGPPGPGNQPPGPGAPPPTFGGQPPNTDASLPPNLLLVTSLGPGGPNGPGNPGSSGEVSGKFGVDGAGGPAPVLLGGDRTPNGFSISDLALGGPNGPGPNGPGPNGPGPRGSSSADGTSLGALDPGSTRFSSPTDLSSSGNGNGSDPSAGLRLPGFTGAIGQPGSTGDDEGRRRKHRGTGPDKKPGFVAPLTAPNAGFSIGRGPGGILLERSAVPGIVARPPTVTSSLVSLKPVQVPGGTTPALAGPPGSSPPAPSVSTQVPGEGTTVVAGDGGLLAPRMPGSVEAMGVGGVSEEGGLGMPPMGGMGGAAGAGGGLGRVERQRLAYLPEEADYWGTQPDNVTSLGSPSADDDGFIEEGFDAVPRRIAGIGARDESEQRETR
ncbi:MAG TPA: hypothetical protein VFI65_13480 [Streptosporangiaceae bacterium]|nr:hypothetical protein [Streptosporangiaceae bacterium]